MGALIPHVLYELQATSVGNKIYVISGATTVTKDGKDVDINDGAIWEFDAQANQWRERAHGPEGLTHQGVAVLNGKI